MNSLKLFLYPWDPVERFTDSALAGKGRDPLLAEIPDKLKYPRSAERLFPKFLIKSRPHLEH